MTSPIDGNALQLISPQLRSELEARYAIGHIQAVHTLAGGYWNTVLHLQTYTAQLVLRISHPTTKVENVAYEHALLQYMGERIPQVPQPLAGRDGATYFLHGGRIVSLFPFMPGTIPDPERETIRESAAHMLACLHRAALDIPDAMLHTERISLRDLDWEHNPMWSWPNVKALLSGSVEAGVGMLFPDGIPLSVYAIWERRSQIEQAKANCQAWVRQLAASGRPLLFAPIHGDYYRGNLLAQDNLLSAVLDWDECKPEWLAWELGRALWEFCQDKNAHTLDRSRARAFLEAYGDAGGPTPPHEFDLLVSFMRCVRVEEVLWALGGLLNGESWDPDYTFHNLLALENLQQVDLFD